VRLIDKIAAWVTVLLLVVPPLAPAQTPPPPPAGPAPAAPPPGSAPSGSAAPQANPFTAEQLDQLTAPIALYPDQLVAQVLMAATYPLEVVQAARFIKDNASLKGDALNEKLKQYDWDDAVKSLVTFPQVLSMMDSKLDWTQKLGDAFLAQQKDVLDSVQRLRQRAQASGNLKSTPEQTVTVEPAPAQSSTVVVQQQPAQVITIAPTNPQVVYVPTYNPTTVYGAWPYPAYPPYAYYPPGYVAGAAMFSFAAGVAVGGALWGNCNWGGGEVDVDVNKNNNFTKNVNRTDVAAKRTERQTNRQNQSWQHNPENRKGAQYRDQATQQKYNRGGDRQAAQSREDFRGRADQGRQDTGGGRGGQSGPGSDRPGGGAGGQRPATADRPGGGDRGGAGGGAGGRAEGGFGGGGGAQARGGGGGGSAFQGMGQGGGSAQNFSNRGQSSRQSMGSSHSATTRPSGGGGGGARGGGGGGGGRGGGRR
jgi:hypothetical protein